MAGYFTCYSDIARRFKFTHMHLDGKMIGVMCFCQLLTVYPCHLSAPETRVKTTNGYVTSFYSREETAKFNFEDTWLSQKRLSIRCWRSRKRHGQSDICCWAAVGMIMMPLSHWWHQLHNLPWRRTPSGRLMRCSFCAPGAAYMDASQCPLKVVSKIATSICYNIYYVVILKYIWRNKYTSMQVTTSQKNYGLLLV